MDIEEFILKINEMHLENIMQMIDDIPNMSKRFDSSPVDTEDLLNND